MKRTHRSLLGISIVTIMALAVVMVGQHNVAQAKEEGCSASTITGVYGFALLEGWLAPRSADNRSKLPNSFHWRQPVLSPSMGMGLLPARLR